MKAIIVNTSLLSLIALSLVTGCTPFTIHVSQDVVEEIGDEAIVSVNVRNVGEDTYRNLQLITFLSEGSHPVPEVKTIDRLDPNESIEFRYTVPNRSNIFKPARVIGPQGDIGSWAVGANSSQLQLGEVSSGLQMSDDSEILLYPTTWVYPGRYASILDRSIQLEHFELKAGDLVDDSCVSTEVIVDVHRKPWYKTGSKRFLLRHSAFWHRPDNRNFAIVIGDDADSSGNAIVPIFPDRTLKDVKVVLTGWAFDWEGDVDRDIKAIGLEIQDVFVDEDTGVVRWDAIATFENDKKSPMLWNYSYAVIALYGEGRFFPETVRPSIETVRESHVEFIDFNYPAINYGDFAIFIRGWRMNFVGDDKKIENIGMESRVVSQGTSTGRISTEVWFKNNGSARFDYEIGYDVLAFPSDVAGYAQLGDRYLDYNRGHDETDRAQNIAYCLSRLR